METGGPAFPANHFDMAEGEHGMTLRDYFAAKAMQGLLAGLLANGMDLEWENISVNSYREADAMLKTRGQ